MSDPASVPSTRRPTKRERTRARLLANAIALFREKGVRETKLAEIAAASDVAPATLFNHFPNRADLAGAWVRGEVEAEARAIARAVRDEARGMRASVRAACRALAELNADDSLVRRAAWQETARIRSGPIEGLREVIALEQQREHVRGDQSAEALADLLADAIEGGLVEGLTAAIEAREAEPRARARTIGARLQARVDLVLDGARKRNERVRPGAFAAGRPNA